MKKHNPETPILIREATGVAPKVWARYGTLQEKDTNDVQANNKLALGRERSEELSGEFCVA